MAAQRIIAGEGDIFVAGGVESISCVQNQANRHMGQDPTLTQRKPEIYWPMLQTAEMVAKRYGIAREKQDEYGAQSQQKACAAAAAGKFKDEIVPITVPMATVDKLTGAMVSREVTLADDEGRREGTTLEAVSQIKPAIPGGVIAAGNASQFSDGAGAVVVMEASLAEKRGLKPRARIVAYANQGDDPTLMLNAPVPAAKKVLAKAGLNKDDIDVWEINEAFAVVAEKFIRDLELDRDKVNINGGAMALGHPIGATGSILIGTALDELERSGGRYGLVTMCAAGGMAPAIIIERI